MKKNYIGISIDKSGSMQHLRRALVRAYNGNIDAIRLQLTEPKMLRGSCGNDGCRRIKPSSRSELIML